MQMTLSDEELEKILLRLSLSILGEFQIYLSVAEFEGMGCEFTGLRAMRHGASR